MQARYLVTLRNCCLEARNKIIYQQSDNMQRERPWNIQPKRYVLIKSLTSGLRKLNRGGGERVKSQRGRRLSRTQISKSTDQ